MPPNEDKKKKGGTLKRLSVIGDSISAMDEAREKEAEVYKKAERFIESADIRQGMSKDEILEICGEPTAEVQKGVKWVYKPPASTYFKGEKIYFFFDNDEKLLKWERIFQE